MIDGRFELLGRLGSGGMGTVWRARDTMLDREVALKEVRPPDPAMLAADPTAARTLRERVLREARALARLGHPNVVTIHHIVDAPDVPHPWIVMELVVGTSLHERLAQGPLWPNEAARIGRDVLSALRAAHEAGIHHRDVKPANVLLRANGSAVLTDFGIAGLRESTSLTATGELIGSPEYIAPERIRGDEGNPASDLWSLGMMLYVAVEGRHPLRRATSLATLAAVLDEPLPPPMRSGPLTPVLSATLVRDPAARPDAATLDRMLVNAERGPQDAMPRPEPVELDGQWPPPPRTGPRATHDVRDARAGGARTAVIASVVGVAVVSGIVTAVLAFAPFGHGTDKDAAGPAPGTHRSATSKPGPKASKKETGESRSPTSPAPPADTTPSTVSGSLLSPAHIRSVVKSLSPLMGGTRVTDFTVYPQYAIASAPTKADKNLYDRFEYRDSAASRSGPGGTLVFGKETVDLDSVDWDVLPALLRKADKELGVPHPTSRYIIVDPGHLGEAPALRVYVSDEYGGGYLAASLKGEVRRMYPRGG
ncbi:hypothetical protein GCM10012280_34430 [Wenjunlia tyrosinilytica]|uniref:non-specific serine/threonine protein kinase n=1 Tax=Wenjunlia tyrosinilytica TaxID=1544741 RepID=A0A917ZQS1_9ACTN|nr:hypothetical protein GCM10012280_34430 [Wenjunlia tyrosinilytica]